MTDMLGHAAQADEMLLRCALHCARAREAAGLASELRRVPDALVAINPSSSAAGTPAGWVVLVTVKRAQLGAREILLCQQSIDEAAERWPAACVLGWRLLAGEEAHRGRGAATPTRAGAGYSQRDAVVASLLRHPETRAAA